MCKCSLVLRPLPDFISQTESTLRTNWVHHFRSVTYFWSQAFSRFFSTRDKIREWPGDEASVSVEHIFTCMCVCIMCVWPVSKWLCMRVYIYMCVHVLHMCVWVCMHNEVYLYKLCVINSDKLTSVFCTLCASSLHCKSRLDSGSTSRKDELRMESNFRGKTNVHVHTLATYVHNHSVSTGVPKCLSTNQDPNQGWWYSLSSSSERSVFCQHNNFLQECLRWAT